MLRFFEDFRGIWAYASVIFKGFLIFKGPGRRVEAGMSFFGNFGIFVFCDFWDDDDNDTTTRKHLNLVSPPPGDEIPREDLPSLRHI